MEASDQRQEETTAQYELSDDESISTGVVTAIATATDAEAVPTAGTEETRVLEPLYTVVDPEALDTLFEAGDSEPRRVTFSYHGYEVTVTGDRRIRLERRE